MSETPMLDRMAKSRIFGLYPADPEGTTVAIGEMCDGYFGQDLTLEELDALADELKAIARACIPCPEHDL